MGTIFYINLRMIQLAKARCRFWIVICLMFSVTFLGCSTILLSKSERTAAMPTLEAFSKAELSIRTAAEARADELAPMDLHRAKEKLGQARQAMAAGRNTEARRLTEVAEVEAELAQARAEAEIIRFAADQLRARGDALRQKFEGADRRGAATETLQDQW